jgi:HPt (histidine-containing phosphotransfer) domain-containing protein
MFKADTNSRLKALDEALAGGKLPVVRQQVHGLKGSASQLGAGKMAALCAQIESADPDTLKKELPGRLRELKAVYERIVRAMDASLLRIPCGAAEAAAASLGR